MTSQSIRKKLNLCFWLPVVAALIIVALYETDILLPGNMAHNDVAEYYAVGSMELITICSIPLALRLFKFKKIALQFERNPEAALLRWGTLRIGMIGVPMFVNTILYYQFVHVALGYMAIIGLLCLAFIYPSEARCEQDMKKQN